MFSFFMCSGFGEIVASVRCKIKTTDTGTALENHQFIIIRNKINISTSHRTFILVTRILRAILLHREQVATSEKPAGSESAGLLGPSFLPS